MCAHFWDNAITKILVTKDYVELAPQLYVRSKDWVLNHMLVPNEISGRIT